MEQKISLMTLGVHDFSAAVDFYENIFGWERDNSTDENFLLYRLDGFRLALYPRDALAEDASVDPDGKGFKGFTLSYNVGSEQAVDDLIARFREKGVQIVKEPQKVFWGGYSGYIADPDGNLWEIAYNPYWEDE